MIDPIDVDKLRTLLRQERKSAWCVDGRFIYGNGTKYSFGDFEELTQAELACAAVNALPELLEVYEASRRSETKEREA
jgi:hypothetical protein